MKYFIVSGEASGDLHGSNLMKALKQKDKEAEFVFLGGDLMEKEGGRLVKHYRQMAFMGGIQIIMNLRTIFRNIKVCKQELLKYQPDALILIDYAGFNLKIAKFAKTRNFRVFYYISPKVWAWRESRVKKIKRYVDKMFVILPFEKDFYLKHQYIVEYVGNPLLDSINQFNETYDKRNFPELDELSDRYIALLAGSRKQEVELLLKEMLECARHYSGLTFVLAAAPSLTEEFYLKFNFPDNVKIVYNKTYYVLKHAYAAIVTSGTATLETGLFEVPQVVIYKTNTIQYYVGSLVVDIIKFKYFSLVNLILQKEAVKEILQFNIAPRAINELRKILEISDHRIRILNEYKTMKKILGNYRPSEKLAKNIIAEINNLILNVD